MVAARKKSFSHADLNALLDRALEEDGTVIIRRPGRRNLAVIPAEKLRELDTTDYLLSSRKNRQRLMRALRDVRAGKGGRRMTLQQLRKLVKLDD